MRLIDSDRLKSMYSINQGNFNTVVGIQKWIDNAPTIQAVPNEVLDEIEEEIKSPNRGTCDYFIVDRIEEIINKYRGEKQE